MASNKPREQDFKFYTINIKLRKVGSKQDLEPEAYVDMFNRLYERKIHEQSSANKHCILTNLYTDKDDNGQVRFLYGVLVQFTFIENKSSWFNLQNFDLDSNFQIPDDFFPDPIKTDFIFVPKAHRFAFRISSSANLRPIPVMKFLDKSLKKVAKSDEIVQTDLEIDETPFTKIEEAKSIKKLTIKINYSNFDIGNDIKQFVDDENRKSNLSELTLIATPKKGDSIDLRDSIILKGALENAISNGQAEATIIDENNVRQKIHTVDYPILLRVHGIAARFYEMAYRKIIEHFRPQDGN